MRNYLLRLGWSHGDDEIISTEQSISWFDIGGIGKSPARFDLTRLESLNSHYLSNTGTTELLNLLRPLIAQHLGSQPTDVQLGRVKTLLPLLKERSKTILELIDNAEPFIDQIPTLDTKADTLLTLEARQRLSRIKNVLAATELWEVEALEALVRGFAESERVKLKDVAQPLRAALTGRTVSPPIFDVMVALGCSACLERLRNIED